MKRRRLTPQQQAFANRLLDGFGNHAEAYRRAYPNAKCSPQQAAVEGYRLSRHPRVAAFITESQRLLREYCEGRISREDYVCGLVDLSLDGPPLNHASNRHFTPINWNA